MYVRMFGTCWYSQTSIIRTSIIPPLSETSIILDYPDGDSTYSHGGRLVKNRGILHKNIKLCRMIELDPDNNFRSGATSKLTFGDLWALISGLKCTDITHVSTCFHPNWSCRVLNDCSIAKECHST